MSWRRFIQLLIGVLLSILMALVALYLWLLPQRGAGIVSATGDQADPQWRYEFSLYGPGTGESRYFSRPLGVATDGARVYVTDTDNHRVCVFDDRGHFQRSVGRFGLRDSQGTPNPAWRPGMLAWPSDADALANGTIWVADTVNRIVQRFDPDGSASVVLPSPGAETVRPGQPGHATMLVRPLSIAVSENRLYVADGFRVSRFGLGGAPDGMLGLMKGGAQTGALHDPWGIVVDEGGSVAIADSLNHRVQAYGPKGDLLWVARGTADAGEATTDEELFALPRGMDRDPAGRLYVADALRSKVIVLSPRGKKLAELGDVGRRPGSLLFPNDVAITKAGTIFVLNKGNNRVDAFRLNVQLPG